RSEYNIAMNTTDPNDAGVSPDLQETVDRVLKGARDSDLDLGLRELAEHAVGDGVQRIRPRADLGNGEAVAGGAGPELVVLGVRLPIDRPGRAAAPAPAARRIVRRGEA